MKYRERIILKNGKNLLLRNAEASDGEAVLDNFNQTHAETDWLLTYPDENTFDVEKESRFLERKAASQNEIELVAVMDGKVVGTAGISTL